MADKVMCEVSFTTGGQIYGRGKMFDADDPIVKRYPSMFSTETRTAATVPGPVTSPPPAAPTAKRATKRATKRASSSKDD